VKPAREIVSLVDEFLDDHVYSEVADLLSERDIVGRRLDRNVRNAVFTQSEWLVSRTRMVFRSRPIASATMNADGGGNGELPRQVQPMKTIWWTELPSPRYQQEKSNSPRYCSRICGMIWMMSILTVSLTLPRQRRIPRIRGAPAGVPIDSRVVSNRDRSLPSPLRQRLAPRARLCDTDRSNVSCRNDTLSRVF